MFVARRSGLRMVSALLLALAGGVVECLALARARLRAGGSGG